MSASFIQYKLRSVFVQHLYALFTLVDSILYVLTLRRLKINPIWNFESVDFQKVGTLCRRFDLLLFTILSKSVAAMIAVVAARVVAGDRPWPALRPFLTGRSLVHSTDTCATFGLRDSYWVFFVYKKLLG